MMLVSLIKKHLKGITYSSFIQCILQQAKSGIRTKGAANIDTTKFQNWIIFYLFIQLRQNLNQSQTWLIKLKSNVRSSKDLKYETILILILVKVLF